MIFKRKGIHTSVLFFIVVGIILAVILFVYLSQIYNLGDKIFEAAKNTLRISAG